MGGIAALYSRAARGVLLYPPVILRRHLFWITSRGRSVVLAISSPPLDHTPHTGALYSIVGLTVVLYSRCERLIDGPYVDAMIQERAVKAASPFLVAHLTCSFHWSLGSTQTPRIHRAVS
jgi:hypothetical protein